MWRGYNLYVAQSVSYRELEPFYINEAWGVLLLFEVVIRAFDFFSLKTIL